MNSIIIRVWMTCWAQILWCSENGSTFGGSNISNNFHISFTIFCLKREKFKRKTISRRTEQFAWITIWSTMSFRCTLNGQIIHSYQYFCLLNRLKHGQYFQLVHQRIRQTIIKLKSSKKCVYLPLNFFVDEPGSVRRLAWIDVMENVLFALKEFFGDHRSWWFALDQTLGGIHQEVHAALFKA